MGAVFKPFDPEESTSTDLSSCREKKKTQPSHICIHSLFFLSLVWDFSRLRRDKIAITSFFRRVRPSDLSAWIYHEKHDRDCDIQVITRIVRHRQR